TEQYSGAGFEIFQRWRTDTIAEAILNVHEGPAPGHYLGGSLKFIGVIKLDADCQAVFDVPGPMQLLITLDSQAVTRTGYPGEAPVKNPVSLRAGYHAIGINCSQMAFEVGRHVVALQWSVNNAGYQVLPGNLLFHMRFQEPWQQTVAGAPPALPTAPAVPSPAPVRQ